MIAEKNRAHNLEEEAWHMYLVVLEAMKRIVTKNINKMHLADIEVEEKSMLELMEYLKKKYFKITTVDITKNYKRFR